MTVTDLSCDRCERTLALPPGMAGGMAGPSGAERTDAAGPDSQLSVRFSYHPGDPHLRDNSGLLCLACWRALSRDWVGEPAVDRCVRCSVPVTRFTSLHVRSSELAGSVQLCADHALDLLNALVTVEPKLDRRAFRFPPPRPAD